MGASRRVYVFPANHIAVCDLASPCKENSLPGERTLYAGRSGGFCRLNRPHWGEPCSGHVLAPTVLCASNPSISSFSIMPSITLTSHAVIFDALFPTITAFMPGKKATEWTDAFAILKHGHWPLLQLSMITSATMDAAAEDGRLDIVVWLHDHADAGCTTDAIDLAAGEGHLEVVKFLVHHRREGCTAKAMNYAAAGGHLDVVEFLYHCTSSYDLTHALVHAADFRQKHVVDWLEAQPFRRHPLVDLCNSSTFDVFPTSSSILPLYTPPQSFVDKLVSFFCLSIEFPM
ncbi:Aste57867_16891 [Aphanomyces stellatus]|uniref:Aste57867_16891 protein n=1 Tax=Aphanomyces stellatus TaxID=120398 RepID=A0A485L6H5_9STRA|nr:hypothetical protein As57867_016833 [Aphanomyces stellatus]VFT93654.1 Aste57867_16891 [Aphanomyces stellatus]